MPNFDRTGPRGFGPMTGRGLGPCGRGRRMGLGRGLGRGNFNYDLVTEADEKKLLEQELKILEVDIKEINKRLKELGKD